jgi:lactate/malate dehydrogenase, NAD binding domain
MARRRGTVKVGVVGVGAVGAATALSLIERGGMCRELVVVDRTTARAKGVATDLRDATPLSATVDVRAGGYDALAGAALVIITAGVNERAGGATDRSDPRDGCGCWTPTPSCTPRSCPRSWPPPHKRCCWWSPTRRTRWPT